MSKPLRQAAAISIAVCAGALALFASAALGQRALGNQPPENTAAPEPVPAQPTSKLPPLRVYEWGVTTLSWDGTPEAEEEMPAAFFSADRIPLEPPVNRGTKPEIKPGTPKPRKPVIYVEHAQSGTHRVAFDLDVVFPNGRVTWAYPKPSRRLGDATIQWDNVEVVNEATLGGSLPAAAKFPAGHWADIARAGSASRLLAGGTVENYLFYEGEQFDIPELDIYKAADGSLCLQNHGAEAVFDVRVNVALDGTPVSHYVAMIPASSADQPTTVTLGEKTRVDALPPAGTLAREAASAGLTAAQAKVFEDIWRPLMHGLPATLTWRRGPKALARMAEIHITTPPGTPTEIHRLGYVMASKVDLGRQAGLDAQAAKAAQGDTEAAKALRQAGMAGAGAVRRLMRSETLGLKARLALAGLLAEMGKAPAEGR